MIKNQINTKTEANDYPNDQIQAYHVELNAISGVVHLQRWDSVNTKRLFLLDVGWIPCGLPREHSVPHGNLL